MNHGSHGRTRNKNVADQKKHSVFSVPSVVKEKSSEVKVL